MGRKKRHSYVAFYPDNWSNGVRILSRVQRSAYHDLCCYMWEFNEPVPAAIAMALLSDLPDPAAMIDDLIALQKITRGGDGSLSNEKAMEEAGKAFALWKAQSKKGEAGAKKRWKKGENPPAAAPAGEPKPAAAPPPANAPAIAPANAPAIGRGNAEQRTEIPSVLPDGNTGRALSRPAEPDGFEKAADFFFQRPVIDLVMASGASEKAARSFIGKVRKGLGDQRAAKAIMDCYDANVSDPVSWLKACAPQGDDSKFYHNGIRTSGFREPGYDYGKTILPDDFVELDDRTAEIIRRQKERKAAALAAAEGEKK